MNSFGVQTLKLTNLIRIAYCEIYVGNARPHRTTYLTERRITMNFECLFAMLFALTMSVSLIWRLIFHRDTALNLLDNLLLKLSTR